MLAADRRRTHRRSVLRCARLGASRRSRSICPRHQGEIAVEQAFRDFAGRNLSPASGAVLPRRRPLPPSRPGGGRPPDPARRVPHRLHALPARGRAGHAAVPVRVPDPGGAAHRHGGRQRLDVRRRHRLRRGGADGGAARQVPAPGDHRRRRSPALPRRRRDLRPLRRHRDRRRAAAVAGDSDDPAAHVDGETACVVVQNPDVFGRIHDYTRARRGLPSRRRAADRGRLRAGLARR